MAFTMPGSSPLVVGSMRGGCVVAGNSMRTPHYKRRLAMTYAVALDPVVSTQWLAQHMQEVNVLDIRGHVDTVEVEPGVEKSTYVADYDAYLESHIPVSIINQQQSVTRSQWHTAGNENVPCSHHRDNSQLTEAGPGY